MPGSKRNKDRKKARNACTNNTSAKVNLSEDIQKLSLDSKDYNENESLLSSSDKYKITYSDIYGRYIIAKKDLNAGEIIIVEKPLVIGPCVSAESVCLGCYKPVNLKNTQYRCSNCKWPICGEKCSGLYQSRGHSLKECEILKSTETSKKLKVSSQPDVIKNLYELIIILRILLMKHSEPDNYKRILMMESHVEERRKNLELWQHYEENVVNRIRVEWHLGADYSADEIHIICGILDVNCFEIGQNLAKARTLYPSAFLLAHDCCPNTAHTDTPDTYELILRTSRKIKRNETITLSYAYSLQGTLKRRDFMQAGKLFWCTCDRCKDPFELGTDCSALVCATCKQGSLRSSEPLNQEAEWRCDNCSFTLKAEKIVDLLDKINNDLEVIDVHDVPGLENFLKRYREVLKPSHYLLLSAKYSLCQLYGRSYGYLLPDMSLEDLRRKETYCREFLQVINKLEPGLTRLRGLIMYELHAPIMMIAQHLMAHNLIKRRDFNNHIHEVVNLLKESSAILLMEPKGSSEYEMGLSAKEALKKMGTM